MSHGLRITKGGSMSFSSLLAYFVTHFCDHPMAINKAKADGKTPILNQESVDRISQQWVSILYWDKSELK